MYDVINDAKYLRDTNFKGQKIDWSMMPIPLLAAAGMMWFLALHRIYLIMLAVAMVPTLGSAWLSYRAKDRWAQQLIEEYANSIATKNI